MVDVFVVAPSGVVHRLGNANKERAACGNAHGKLTTERDGELCEHPRCFGKF